MQLRKLGQSDIQISSIIINLWQTGEEMWLRIDDKGTIQAIRAAFDAGTTTFDTAEANGKGQAERILASATSGQKANYFSRICMRVCRQHLQGCAR